MTGSLVTSTGTSRVNSPGVFTLATLLVVACQGSLLGGKAAQRGRKAGIQSRH